MAEPPKRAPVQRLSGGIPWDMHLRAYEAYSKKWGPQEAMIDLDGRNCRGGFSVSELDDFIPGWRSELESREGAKLIRNPRFPRYQEYLMLQSTSPPTPAHRLWGRTEGSPMPKPTKISFFGVLPAPYAGGPRKGCAATDASAEGWHVVVGGTSCTLATVQDFTRHFGDFLRIAYAAGVADAKAEIRDKLGL